MNRQQRRAAERKDQKAKTKVYNLTEEQLQAYVRQAVETESKAQFERIMNIAANEALILILALPLEVLMDHYWSKSYKKKIPEFTNYVLEYCERWQNGEIDMDELKKDLWEYGHVRLETEK